MFDVVARDASRDGCDGCDIDKEQIDKEQIGKEQIGKEQLVREIHHRIKNNLQIVLSILQLQIRRLDDSIDTMPLRESANRIHSIALSHEMVYRASNLSSVSMAAYARELLSSLVQTFAYRSRIKYVVSREDVILDLERAIPLGLILSELVTSSLKCAALDPLGELHLSVRYKALPNERVRFCYSHSGSSHQYKEILFDKGKSLSWRLIEVLIAQVKGTLDLDREQPGEKSFEIVIETAK